MSLHRSRPSDKGGRGGVGHPDHEKRRVPGLKKFFVGPSGLIWSKNKGGEPRAPPLDPPLLIEEMFSTLTERNNILKPRALIHIFNTCCLRIFCFAFRN